MSGFSGSWALVYVQRPAAVLGPSWAFQGMKKGRRPPPTSPSQVVRERRPRSRACPGWKCAVSRWNSGFSHVFPRCPSLSRVSHLSCPRTAGQG